jgi:very-short-patch-repair endonuclease
MSLPEVLLWRALRDRPDGLKFRRQHPSGPFILDFFCSDARLAVEVDGEAHSRGDRPRRDEERDAWFLEAGVETFRIAAAEVLRDTDAVVRAIVAQATGRLPLHHPAAPGGPPPRGKLGEEL